MSRAGSARKQLVISEPVLNGRNIYLESLSNKHISQAYTGWLNDKVVCRENSHGGIRYTLKMTREYVQSVDKSDKIAAFAIMAKDKKKHVGNISLGKISWDNSSGDISILIGEKDYWGKGIASEAYRLIIDYGFNKLYLHRLESGMTVRNKAMIKVAKKSGMKKEGVSKDALCKYGEYIDIVRFAIINPKHKKRGQKI